MKEWTESWFIRTSFFDFYIFLWESLEVVEIQRLVPPRDAALEVDDWGHDSTTHHILADIFSALHGPGMIWEEPEVAVPLEDVLERIKRGLITGELVLVKVDRPCPSKIGPPVVPPPVPRPPVPPPLSKAWIKIRVIHADGAPVLGREYLLTLPNGEMKTGELKTAGPGSKERVGDNTIHLRGIDRGACSIKFPHKAKQVQPGERPPRTEDG